MFCILDLVFCLTCRSEDEDEEEEEPAQGAQPPPLEVEPVEGEANEEAPKKKRKAESMEMVEYSPDELQSVDREMLNAEITQLEGMF